VNVWSRWSLVHLAGVWVQVSKEGLVERTGVVVRSIGGASKREGNAVTKIESIPAEERIYKVISTGSAIGNVYNNKLRNYKGRQANKEKD
jgi:hypothetical protein